MLRHGLRYRAVYAVLVTTSLLLAGCGQELTSNQDVQLQISKKTFQVEQGELQTAFAGEPIGAIDFTEGTLSLGTLTPGLPTQILGHAGSAVNVIPLDGLTTADVPNITLQAVPGLAGSGIAGVECFSFESINARGQYLRHFDSRVRLEPRGNSLFDADATWCTRKSLDGGTDAENPNNGISKYTFESFNFPGRYLRHYNGGVWLAQKGGPLPSDNPFLFEQDASWQLYDITAQ